MLPSAPAPKNKPRTVPTLVGQSKVPCTQVCPPAEAHGRARPAGLRLLSHLVLLSLSGTALPHLPFMSLIRTWILQPFQRDGLSLAWLFRFLCLFCVFTKLLPRIHTSFSQRTEYSLAVRVGHFTPAALCSCPFLLSKSNRKADTPGGLVSTAIWGVSGLSQHLVLLHQVSILFPTQHAKASLMALREAPSGLCDPWGLGPGSHNTFSVGKDAEHTHGQAATTAVSPPHS